MEGLESSNIEAEFL